MARGRRRKLMETMDVVRLFIFALIILVVDGGKAKPSFHFTRSLYTATMPENARGRVYAVPQEGKMGVYLPWYGIITQPHLVNRKKSPTSAGTSTEHSNTTAHQFYHQTQNHQLVRFRIVSGDKHNFFKVESEIVGDFAYLRIRTRSSMDVDLNRELTPEFLLRIKAVYRRQSIGTGGGSRNLETRTEVLLKIIDQNGLSPVFLPEHYQVKIDRRTPMFSSLTRVTASDADFGLNGEIYYQLMNRTDFFAVHPTSGVVSLIRSLSDFPISTKYFNLSIVAVDRASRLFEDSRSNQGMANLAKVNIEIMDENNAKKSSSWLVKTNKDKEEKKFRYCGLIADSLCATLTLSDETTIVEHLEINNGEEILKYFYIQHSERRRRGENEFEIRSISTIPTGFYNLTLSPINLNIFFNVNATSGMGDNLCDHIDDEAYLDIWMKKMEFIFEIPEWAPDGFLIGDFRLHPKIGKTRFELKKTEEEVENELPFMVTMETGILYLKLKNNITSNLNYRRRSTYEFFVHVRRIECRPEKEEKRKVTVRIKDCNDHAPKFTDNCDRLIFEIDRPPSMDAILCQFKATDEDEGENGRIFYDLSTNSTSISRFFRIDHDRGELTLRNSTAFFSDAKKNGQKSYLLIVRAMDYGWPLKRVSQKELIITFNNSGILTIGSTIDRWTVESDQNNRQNELTNENLHAPVVASEWSFEIEENARDGQRVGIVQASDADNGYAGILLFNIDSDQDDSTIIDERPFGIDLYNGTIFVFRPLDREKREEYSFRISITDLGKPSRRVWTKVTIKILDVNDNAPRFEKSSYRIRLKENIEPGTNVLQLKAFDDDSEGNGRIRYSLMTRTPYFNLDSDTGILTLKAELDRERIDKHRLLIQAQDYGQPPLAALVNVTVMVEDVNDNAPVCWSKLSKAYVPEDYPAGALVTCVDADDPDVGENGRISYRLIDATKKSTNLTNEATPFFIDSATGCIRLAWTMTNSHSSKNRKPIPKHLELILDYERQAFYNLTIELTDFGKPRQLKNICNVFVEVVDVNENRYPPRFLNSNGDDDEEPIFAMEAEIYENEMAPTFVKQVRAVDPDAAITMADPKPIYSIVDGDGLGIFTIDQDGRIHASRSLDRETKPFYWLTIMARDRAAAPLSSSVDLFIRILDRNDNPPVSLKSIYYATIMENSPPNVVFLRVEATDADFFTIPSSTSSTGSDGEEDDKEFKEQEMEIKAQQHEMFQALSPLTFKITHGDPQSFFKIDSKTGYISTDRRALDRETTPELELEVTISDNGEPEPLISTVTVIVKVEDENDHAPVFPLKMMNFDIPERNRKRGRNKQKKSKEQFLCRTFAYDEDQGKNGEIRYAITDGIEQNLVRIDSETGSIFALENSTWNDSQTLTLTIRATDNGAPPKFAVSLLHLTVASDGSDAKDADLKSLKITSNFATNPLHIAATDPVGHQVGILEAMLTDDNDGKRIWFYILGGNEENVFALRPDTGVLLLAKKPTLQTYTLTFLATVDGVTGVEGQASIIVQPIIEDERPKFSTDRIQIQVSENQSLNSVLLRLPEYLKSNYDREEIRFFLSENYFLTNRHNHSNINNNEGVFQVDAKSGAVYLKQTLDREHQSKYSFKIGAQSRYGKRGYAIVDVQVLDVNYHTPKFVNRHIQLRISQATSPGTVIHQLAAFDGDEGVNGRLTYSLTMGNHKDAFSIDSQTGALRLLRSLTKSDLASEFVLTVKVEDGGRPALFDTANIRILLTSNGIGSDSTNNQANSGVVQFTQDVYTFRASEKLPIGSLIGHVQADTRAAIEYNILEDLGGYFYVHPLTGAVTLKRAFDFEHSAHVEATIRIIGSSAVTAPTISEDTARLVVTLIDGNDHGPVFKKLFYETAVEENAPAGTVVLIVEATDEDTGQSGVVTYHIADDWASRYFEIDYHTGAVRLVRPLDYERKGEQRFEFNVAAEDLGEPKMYSMRPTLVTIKVLDVNDLPPIFDQKMYDFSIYTPVIAGMKIGHVEAVDEDTVGTIQYLLRKSTGCSFLEIDRTSGIVKLSRQWKEIKMGNQTKFSCTIVATDGLHETEAVVNVKMASFVQSTSGLRFEQNRYEISIKENSSSLVSGMVLLRLRVSGVELDEQISFGFLNSNDEIDGSYFSLNPTTGVVTTTEYTKNLDRELTPNLTYLVEAKMVRRIGTIDSVKTLLSVHILDENDNAPRFVGLPYSISISNQAEVNESVFRVKAIDLDEGDNGKVKYSLSKNPRFENLFKIDENNGEIFVNGDLRLLEKSKTNKMQISVIASDSGAPSLSTTTTIDIRLVSASTPIFPKSIYNASVYEGPQGVGTVIFESNSFGISSSSTAILGYTIRTDETDGLESSIFDLDFTTGRLILRKALDRKRTPTIRLPIRIRDYSLSRNGENDQSFSDAVVVVNVLDYNDHAPKFDSPLYVVNIYENTSLNGNEPLVTFRATDDDEGINSQFTFMLKNNEDRNEEYFRLNAETGALMLVKRLDFESQKKYALTVVAKDFGTPALSSSAKVHIHVLDVNDNPPAFTQMAFEVELPSPKWSAGQFVGQALASDPDECDRGRLRYSIFSGNDGDWFTIDERSGVLRTASSSSESSSILPSNEYSLNLTVTDGAHSALGRFLVKVRSGTVNGITKFSKNLYHARVKETSTAGTFVTEIRVEDRIGSGIPTLRYRLVGSSLFRMEETTGKIFTSAKLDGNLITIHTLTILAEKWSDFTIVANSQLQITIISENNRPPKFLADRFMATVTSETKPNTIILKINAVDMDRDDVLEYSFDSKSSNNFEDYFFLDSNTGALAIRRNLESVVGSIFKTVLRVTDRGNPPQKTTAPLEIRIVSEAMAVTSQMVSFSKLEYIYTIREDSNIGTEIGQLNTIRRGGSNGELHNYRFSIVTLRSITNDIDWMSLNEKSGSLRIAERLDRESTAELQFYVALFRTTGSKEMISMASVRILIEDADDNGPVFENIPATDEIFVVNAAEDASVGSLVTVFSASDPDSGEGSRVTYWIEESEMNIPFRIDAKSGWLRTTSELDRESQENYSFKIVAGSSNTIELRTSLNVTVKVADANDQKPIFEKREYQFRLDNGFSAMPGLVIGRVLAKDADLPPNNEIRYFITKGNERGIFEVRMTGEIYLARKLEDGDRSANDYRLTILASDGLFEDETFVNVSVHKKSISICKWEEMICPKSKSLHVEENASIGKVIGHLDKLPTGQSYRLLMENGIATTPNFDFSIKENGEISILRSLDYERRKSYEADVEIVYDGHETNGCGSMECIFRLTINIQDINDCAPEFDFDAIPNEISITENYNGTFPYFLGRVHATDADSGSGGQVKYRLTMENKKDDDLDLFTIDPNGGALFLWRSLDRERREFYNLTVIAADGGRPKSLSAQRSIVIKVLDLNDNPPIFVQKSYDVSAPEDTPIGVVLIHVEAISADSGMNAVVTYGLEKSGDVAMFEINEKTGEVRLRQSLDYETTKEHSVVVIATDGGQPPLSSHVQLRLRVIDVNDNEPIFEKRHYTVRVPENSAIRSRLIRVSATDLDSDKNGQIGYNIEPANRFFQMSNDRDEPGWIILADTIDYEKSTRHEFQVMAYDHGQPSKSAVAVVTVEVIDVNDNPPKILNCNRTLVVKAYVSTAAPLLTFQASDADGPSNGKPFHYAIIEPPKEDKSRKTDPANESIFKIDPHGALVALQTPLEFPEYFVQVTVRDSGDPSMTSQCRLHIRVTDESRFPPRLLNTSFLVLSYMGEMGSGGVIGRVSAVDDDPKDQIRYSLVNVNTVGGDSEGLQNEVETISIKEKENVFSVDSDDGRISAAAELQPGEYMLNVSATDGRFETFSTVGVSIRSITTKMLDSAVSLRISDRYDEGNVDEDGNFEGHRRRGGKKESFDERLFVERHLKALTRAVATAVNARSARFVHVLSVQKAKDGSSEEEYSTAANDEGISIKKKSNPNRMIRKLSTRQRRSRKDDETNLWKHGVDVLISVQKSRHQDFFKPEYIRKTLEQKLEEVERQADVKIISLVTETCRPDRCKNGGVCRERLHLYEMVNNAVLTETFSFVSPTHRRWAECVCADGFGGEMCENELNECAKRPCTNGRVCVAHEKSMGDRKDESMVNGKKNENRGYRCLCTGIGCPGFDSVHLMSRRSWIRYTLSENLETEMKFSLTFRTMARSGVLLYSAGRTDFQSLELFGGQLRYRYDLGDGETLLYVDGRPSVDDGLWHTVRLERKRRTAKLTLDNRPTQMANAPGGAFVLNLHGADVYVGSDGSGNNGFVGCLKDVTLNDDILPWHGAGIQLYDVDVGRCSDDEFKRILTVATGTKNTCGWCLNNGTCISGETAWSCICPLPYTGLRCETMMTKFGQIGICSSSPCQNGATCLVDKKLESGFRCQCPPGWTGPLCRRANESSPNIVGGLWGISVPELIGIIAIFLVLILLTVVIVLLCRRQRSSKRKKILQRRNPSATGHKYGENEPMFSESDVTPLAYAQRQFAANNMLVSGGPCGAMVVVSDPNSSSTPMSPAACSLPASFGNGNGPPPLPPRARGFQPHRGSKLSNLESALSTGIPTVQVRPLSMSERQSTPVDGRTATGGYMETAANYGSAAEELERLGRRTSPTLEDLDDWKAALNRMNADSLEKLKAAAGITDEQYWQNESGSGRGGVSGGRAGPPSSTGENVGAPSSTGIRCLPEEERSSGSKSYHWDYSDWNSTVGHHARGLPADVGPYATLSHLSVATDDDYGANTLPRGVCRLEETDSEYAANDESGNEDNDAEEKSELDLRSRLRGDEFTKELLALTKSFGKKNGTSDSEEGSSSRPILSTFKGQNNGGVQSYLDRYLPRPVEPPNSTASERKLLLSGAGENTLDESTSSALADRFSDDEDDDEEFTTPSAVCQTSLLDTSKISEFGGGASSDGERSTDSVVQVSASGGGVKREDSALIVCSISDDDDEGEENGGVDQAKNGDNNNRTFLKKSKKQTQV